MNKKKMIEKIKEMDTKYMEIKHKALKEYSEKKLEKIFKKSSKRLKKVNNLKKKYSCYVDGPFAKFFFKKTGTKLTPTIMDSMDKGLYSALAIADMFGHYTLTPKMVDFLNKYSKKGKIVKDN